MQNLDQLRACNAIKSTIGAGKDGGGSVAKKVATQIQQNGLIGALAFAIADGSDGQKDSFIAILNHLRESGLNYGIQAEDLANFLAELCRKDASDLRAITSEAMAFMNYLRRLASQKDN